MATLRPSRDKTTHLAPSFPPKPLATLRSQSSQLSSHDDRDIWRCVRVEYRPPQLEHFFLHAGDEHEVIVFVERYLRRFYGILAAARGVPEEILIDPLYDVALLNLMWAIKFTGIELNLFKASPPVELRIRSHGLAAAMRNTTITTVCLFSITEEVINRYSLPSASIAPLSNEPSHIASHPHTTQAASLGSQTVSNAHRDESTPTGNRPAGPDGDRAVPRAGRRTVHRPEVPPALKSLSPGSDNKLKEVSIMKPLPPLPIEDVPILNRNIPPEERKEQANIGQGGRIYIQHNTRDSLLIFPDPEHPDVHVRMPSPVGVEAELYVNQQGVIIGASLPALIRLLTSTEAMMDWDLTEIFFNCFRMFSSPIEILNLLIKKYGEKPPGDLTTAQRRVWDLESRATRLRVSKLIFQWLSLHWRPESDNAVIEELADFAYHVVANDIPRPFFTKIRLALHACGDPAFRGRRVQKRAELVKFGLKLTAAPPTKFTHPRSDAMLRGDFRKVDVLDFDKKHGHVELARQLTLMASELYRLVDPEESVIFWQKGDREPPGSPAAAIISFENGLRHWAISSILDKEKLEVRAKVLKFWLQVAVVCLPDDRVLNLV